MEKLTRRLKTFLPGPAEWYEGRKGIVVLAGLALLPLLAFSSGWDVVDAPSAPAISVGGLVLRLGVVLALLYGSMFALRSYLGRQGGRALPGRRIEVVEKQRLGAQQALYLVAVEGRMLLLGSTPANICTLADLGEAPHPAECPSAPAANVPFAEHLRVLGVGVPGFANQRAAGAAGRDRADLGEMAGGAR